MFSFDFFNVVGGDGEGGGFECGGRSISNIKFNDKSNEPN